MQLVYFSRVREQIGLGDELFELPNDVSTVAELVAVLAERSDGYATALSDMTFIRVAVNQTHVGLDHPLKNSDEVAFFPPVTGG
ncbi:MAG: molybdopterin converting factor subunit 1 [Kordiimonas sp.]